MKPSVQRDPEIVAIERLRDETRAEIFRLQGRLEGIELALNLLNESDKGNADQ